jgi:cobalt-zinc-cadmium efflux system protein
MPHDDLHRHGPLDALTGHTRTSISLRALGLAVLLTLGFAGVEFFAALMSGSIALMADAGHMVTDATSLFLALVAQIVALRPPSDKSSYGHGRIEALAAFVNSVAMLGIVAWISIEAIQRFSAPREITGQMVMIVAAIGLGINVLVAWVLSKDQDSLNTKAALIHVLGDLLGSVAALASGLVIYLTGWTPIDPLLSLFVCVLILRSTLNLLKTSAGILLEHVPESVDFRRVADDLKAMPGICAVHNLHIWEISPGHIALTAHLEISEIGQWATTLQRIQDMLRRDHGIDHATVQPEPTSLQTPAQTHSPQADQDLAKP